MGQSAHDKLIAYNNVMVTHGFTSSVKYILAKRAVAIQPNSRATIGKTFFEKERTELDSYFEEQKPLVVVAEMV